MQMNFQDFVLKLVQVVPSWRIVLVHVSQFVKQVLQILKLNFVFKFVLNILMDM